jgi:hypothetical protein
MEKAKLFFEETNKGFRCDGYNPLRWDQLMEANQQMWLTRMRTYEENKK